MIYKFSTRFRGSGLRALIQMQAPAGTPVKEIETITREMLSKEGIEVDSIRYLETIDSDFLPKCAVQGCDNPVVTPGSWCEKCRVGTIHGWYTPTADVPANNVCVVEGCGQASAYHLCKKHAVPGTVVGIQGRKFVISFWLVEREGKVRVISLGDNMLGDLFGSREAFEKRLRKQGYHIHHIISRQAQLDSAKGQNPGLPFTRWTPHLPDGEDDATGEFVLSAVTAYMFTTMKLQLKNRR